MATRRTKKTTRKKAATATNRKKTARKKASKKATRKRTARKKAAKKTTRKKTAKKVARKKASRKKTAKKVARKKASRKKTAKKTTRKKASRKKTAKKVARKKASRKKTAKKTTRKKASRKKTAKKVARKKASRKKTAKKTTRKKASRKKTAKKVARKKTAKKATAKKAARKTEPKPARPRSIRLGTRVRPTEVDLHVDVDPTQSAAFRGEVTHHLTLSQRTREIELHADDLQVSKPVVEVAGRRVRATILRDPARQTIRVQTEEPLPAGTATLQLSFRGRLRKDLRGLYAAGADDRRYAFTQLEAADARRFFPCFDEPAFKAAFQISVTTGRDNTVLSNNPAEKIEPLEGGRKRVQFARTPLLSTYLLALAIGELEASEPTFCGKTEIRVWHVPGKGHLTAFALEAARETLGRLESYFDLPYPYEKLDLVAAPDFEAGAMENAGAVFFRETLLLSDPDTATLQEKKRIAEVVCHELAHMWYGDLVTMAWWDDLWLNEAFATWMAFQVVDAWKPEWKMWNDFQHYRSAALGMDALDGTHPIYTKVRTPEEATENFDLITYEKGASVVRMIERYLGAETFRAGVREYIRTHQESNTVASDLWDALSQASEQPVEPIVRTWIEQSGFPLLRLERHDAGEETRIALRQERFRAKGQKGRRGAEPLWPIPFVARFGTGRGQTRTERTLFAKASDTLRVPVANPTFLYGNADEGGFFRPLHAPEELRALGAHLDELTAVEKMGLVGHQWAAARAGLAEIGPLLDLLLSFRREPDPDVLVALSSPLGGLCASARRSGAKEVAEGLQARIVRAFGPTLQELGLESPDADGTEPRLRRSALLALVGQIGEDEATGAEATRLCDAYLEDRRAVDPNLADGVVSLAASRGDAARFERYLAEAEKSATPQDGRRFLMALGSFREPALVDRALSLMLTDTIRTQDVAILLTRMLGNREARETTWTFMTKRWPALSRRMPPMMITRPIEATPSLGGRRYRKEVASFFRKNPVPTGQRAIRQALEQFDLDIAFDHEAGPALEAWLAGGRPA